MGRHVRAWDDFPNAAEPASKAFIREVPLFLDRGKFVVQGGQTVPRAMEVWNLVRIR